MSSTELPAGLVVVPAGEVVENKMADSCCCNKTYMPL